MHAGATPVGTVSGPIRDADAVVEGLALHGTVYHCPGCAQFLLGVVLAPPGRAGHPVLTTDGWVPLRRPDRGGGGS